jgi:hypothetical protein
MTHLPDHFGLSKIGIIPLFVNDKKAFPGSLFYNRFQVQLQGSMYAAEEKKQMINPAGEVGLIMDIR